MKEVQEMKRIHQRFSKKRQMEREARQLRRQQEYEKFFGTAPKTDSMENNNMWTELMARLTPSVSSSFIGLKGKKVREREEFVQFVQ